MNHTNTKEILESGRKAAMYVRMSTDQQKYSTENQEKAIREYAQKHDIEIIQTFADKGKSGLDISGREGLKSLLETVKSGNAEFSLILVLDISRWGRFQDADESAYYEYICRRSNINVEYVSEQFKNDGSPTATIIKSVKRAMAGEYSRELSAKVFAGQCRLIEKGFRQGGPAGFGLRRMLLDETGNQKGILKRGEHKSLQTDRVILVPGPEDEIQVVQWIYQSFVEKQLSETQIADTLNQRGVLSDWDKPWTRGTIHQILTNEKYIGNNVYNKTSCKLKKKRVNNEPSIWVRSDGVFEPLIEPKYFYAAQQIILKRSIKLSDEEFLEKLKVLYDREGWLSGILIDEEPNMPSSSAYQNRFGSLIRAYQLVNFQPDRDLSYIAINKQLRQLHPEIIESIKKRIADLGGKIEHDLTSNLLLINDEITVSIIIARCFKTEAEKNRWELRFDAGLKPDITIAIRMNSNNDAILDYYVIPLIDIEVPKIRLSENNGIALDCYRNDSLEDFFSLVKRSQI